MNMLLPTEKGKIPKNDKTKTIKKKESCKSLIIHNIIMLFETTHRQCDAHIFTVVSFFVCLLRSR